MFCIKIIKSVKEHVTWTDDKRSVVGQVAEYLLLKLEMQIWSQVEEEKFPKTVSDPHMCPEACAQPSPPRHTHHKNTLKKKKHVLSYQGNVNKSYTEISTPLSHRAVIKVQEMWHTYSHKEKYVIWGKMSVVLFRPIALCCSHLRVHLPFEECDCKLSGRNSMRRGKSLTSTGICTHICCKLVYGQLGWDSMWGRGAGTRAVELIQWSEHYSMWAATAFLL